MLSPALARRDPLPPWQWSFLLGFVGVRGVVSLAAALALPLTTITAASFPDRDLIVFVTFGVIIVTLIGLAIRDDWFRFSPYGDRRFSRLVFGLMLVTVALTLWSGIGYLWKNREVFLSDA